MDRGAALRCLTPTERSVLILWHRYDGDAEKVEEDLRGALDVIPVPYAGRSRRVIAERCARVPTMVEEIRAKLERRVELLRRQEAREERERMAAIGAARRRRSQMSETYKQPDGAAPEERPPDRPETWATRSVRLARERRAEIIAEVGPMMEELRQVEAVLRVHGLSEDEIVSAVEGLTVLAKPGVPSREELEAGLEAVPGPPVTEEPGEPEPPSPAPQAPPETSDEPETAATLPESDSEPEAPAEKPPRERKPPGKELGVPEELAGMPAVKGKVIAREASIEAARRQLRVLQAVQARAMEGNTVVPKEVAAFLELRPTQVAEDLRDLWREDLVQRTGRNRRSAGQTIGRSSVEYTVPEVVEGSAPDPHGPPSASGTPTAEQVRDVICKTGLRREEEFSPAQVCEEGERMFPDVPWEVEPVTLTLEELAGGTLIGDVSPVPEVRLFRYAEADGPGRAAEIDRELRRSEAPAGNGGGPVAGTGQPSRAGDHRVNEILRKVRAQGARVDRAGDGHFLITTADRRSATIPSSPGGSMRQHEQKLRSIGLTV